MAVSVFLFCGGSFLLVYSRQVRVVSAAVLPAGQMKIAVFCGIVRSTAAAMKVYIPIHLQ